MFAAATTPGQDQHKRIGHNPSGRIARRSARGSADPLGISRRMQLLERKGWFSGPQGGVTFSRALCLEDMLAAYALVHDVYVESGYMTARPDGLRMRAFDAIAETATFVAKVGEEVVGVCSVVIDSDDLGLPSDDVFGPEIDALRSQGQRLCEGTNWAIHPEYRRTNILTELMRCCVAYALTQQCDALLAAISPGHRPFYELLTFETIGAERSYSQQVRDPVVMVKIALTGIDERFTSDLGDEGVLRRYYLTENPYRFAVMPWNEQAENRFQDADFLRQLTVEQSDLLQRCNARELAAISRHWGEETFLKVMGHSVLRGGVGL